MPLNVTEQQKGELATAYACMILSDCKAKINAENVDKILSSAQIKVEPFLPKLFCQLLQGKDLMEMFSNIGGGSAVAGGGAAGAAGEGESEKKEEKKEEEEDDGGFDFSDEDDE
mmetsp:Transcript_2021/g.4626  ORF Transcript_2021/g.4626 Transcript_2021/m.4626 type:complete len:114 (+) Transcript_2021:84-425(+)|eukprot:CAMPEP_0114509962 /NCGR_PEP_ID=MMETSP0109-20121206/13511_1 /TAXON_ID=29199 /ORGANISM="Chlorarachnion reptans, Strain CCCM449" /LENGTH=113 /DNA_ID=CAMNT_0001689193 /DNA_START=46 /DNA_END=387 /DNA_ORIENTATION=+